MTGKELDRRFRHLGRIKRAWGSTHRPTIRRMDDMLTTLFDTGHWEILKGIRDGTYTPLEVYAAFRINELERLPTAATLQPLQKAMESWIAKKECSEAHRRSLRQSLRHIVSAMARSSPAVSDIPGLLKAYRDTVQGKHPRSFNIARAAAQSFARSTSGRNSKLWSDISQVEVLRVTPQRRKKPLTPAEFQLLVARMRAPYHLMAKVMACTGMGPAEYWGEWEYIKYGLAIHGKKRAGRDRVVPAFIPIGGPWRAYAAFRRALAEASAGLVTPYDLRRTYANWLESAGIPRTRRRMYMGHGAKDVTDLYEQHDVERFLIEDGDRLSTYVFGANYEPRLTLGKA